MNLEHDEGNLQRLDFLDSYIQNQHLQPRPQQLTSEELQAVLQDEIAIGFRF